MKVDNAIIMAAGTSSRFAPLSYERPKALLPVKGEILIERQIRQLQAAGIPEVIVVTGYKAEQFSYLKEKYGVSLVYNADYLIRNNNASIYAAKDYLKNSYICSSDNYFRDNPFEKEVDESYYAAIYKEGATNEWCITERNGWIQKVKVGGRDSWIMLGHAFWSETFSRKFLKILESEYEKKETADKLWEAIYMEHMNELPMKVRKYGPDSIYEFDTLDELRQFDDSYINNTRSEILKKIAEEIYTSEKNLWVIKAFRDKDNTVVGFTFQARGKKYKYYYKTAKWEEISK